MKPISPYAFALRYFRINWIHIFAFLQRHVKAAVKERNILHPVQLLQTSPNNQQRRIIMTTISSISRALTVEQGHLSHPSDEVHRVL